MLKSQSSIRAGRPLLRIPVGQNKRIENGFRSTGLVRLVEAGILIAIVRSIFVPESHSLAHIIDKNSLLWRRSGLRQRFGENRAGERIWQSCMTGHTKRTVTACSARPFRPLCLSLVEIASRSEEH